MKLNNVKIKCFGEGNKQRAIYLDGLLLEGVTEYEFKDEVSLECDRKRTLNLKLDVGDIEYETIN